MPDLTSVFIKLDRASEKVAKFLNSINEFCRDHPITLDAQLRENRLGINLVCNMKETHAPLAEWSIELGEIVYLLRSALDNMIYLYAQDISNPPPSPRDLQFPIIQDLKLYNKAVQKIAHQLPKGIAELLEKIQPYQRSNPNIEGTPELDPLVLLNWISNHDKHRMPVPFLIPPKEITLTHMHEFLSENDAAENTPPDVVIHLSPLSHNALLAEYRTKHPLVRSSGTVTITAQVAFETHTGTREISESIMQLLWYTKLVVNEFSNTET